MPNARRGMSMGGMLTLSLPRAIAVAAALLIAAAADRQRRARSSTRRCSRTPEPYRDEDLSLENHAIA